MSLQDLIMDSMQRPKWYTVQRQLLPVKGIYFFFMAGKYFMRAKNTRKSLTIHFGTADLVCFFFFFHFLYIISYPCSILTYFSSI